MNRIGAIKCPACLRSDYYLFGEKNDHLFHRCRNCQTVFIDLANLQRTNDSADLYEHYYDGASFKLPDAARRTLNRIADTFENHRKFGKLLDIGFGEGGMLQVATKKNWECFGTEISPQAIEFGSENGWTVTEDALNDSRFPREGFDVVTMIELIEHVPNPDEYLGIADAMLRPGGLLFLTTPNTQSINRRLLGLEWSMFSPPEHIVIWSPRGIKNALERNHFAVKTLRTEGFNPVEVVAKFRTKQNAESQVHRNEAAFALNEAFTRSSWRRFVKTSINLGLSFFMIGDGIKIWAVKKGMD